jgi:DNA-binding transcriptional regulator YhcF (GntR family)
VELGTLSSGAPLPTVRQLAADLGVAPGTVARCYQELRLRGIVTGGRRHGTRVADVHALPPAARQSRLADAAARLVGGARRLGADDQEIREAVTAALERALPHHGSGVSESPDRGQDCVADKVGLTPSVERSTLLTPFPP